MVESSIMSLRILSFNIFYSNGDLALFRTKFLPNLNPDIIFTQEDNGDKDLFGNNYNLILKCGHNWSDCETVGVYYNNKTVKETDISSIRKLYTTPKDINASRRNAIIISIKGITIANIHLEGGRYIDTELLEDNGSYFNKYLDYKLELLNDVVAENPNIICGDFNSVYSENELLYGKFLGNQFKYFSEILKNRKFTINDKLLIKKWNCYPYKLLKKMSYEYVKPNNELKYITSSRGNSIIDGFWLNTNLKKANYESQIINLGAVLDNNYLLGNISDHNPVLLKVFF